MRSLRTLRGSLRTLRLKFLPQGTQSPVNEQGRKGRKGRKEYTKLRWTRYYSKMAKKIRISLAIAKKHATIEVTN